MPIYEFRCQSAHEYERSVPISARDEDLLCPDCGAPARRRMSAPQSGQRRTSSRALMGTDRSYSCALSQRNSKIGIGPT